MRPEALARYWHTLRPLKPVQWYGRAWFRLHRPTPSLGPPPPLRRPSGAWVAPAGGEPSLLGPTRLRFLNESHDCATAAAWNDPARDKLWLYNLHYFDDLAADGAEARTEWQRAWVARWIDENPPASGNGWEPYPCSLRIVNWIKWSLGGQPLAPAWQRSLAVQLRWLRRRLEFHLLGNHLFANAKALLFGGLYFEGDEAAAWQRRALAILRRQLPEQVLADGGHFERSPMYHALMLQDVLDLLNAIRALAPPGSPAADFAPALQAVVAPMLRWLAAMTHPDATPGLFNDCAAGVAPTLEQLQRYAARLGLAPPDATLPPLLRLDASGYARAALGPAVLLVDAAPVGPDYLPGHAHADTLSFELSVAGRRLVVNGGTSCYGSGPARLRERSTAAHSTVEVAGQDSSQVWSGFRVGRRARPSPWRVSEADGRIEFAASHDGYRFLPGRPVHERHWLLDPAGLSVSDRVSHPELPAVARYLLAPGLALRADGDAAWLVIDATRRLARVAVLAGTAAVVPAQCASRFGIVEATVGLAVTLAGGRADTRWTWLDDDAHPLSH